MSGRVPPSSRAKSRARRSGSRAKAAALYERFTGHDAEEFGRVSVNVPDVLVMFGELDGVLYTTVRDGKVEHYKHEFHEGDKPLLCTSPDGKQLFIVGGRYRFTARGIVDQSDKLG